MSNIAFVGFMGTGKTAVSKKIAEKLNREYVNIDSLIEKREAKPINKIFSENGEPYFRKIESQIVEELSKKDNLIIDCGGGVVLNQANIDNLKKNGIIVCLTATPDVIYERTKKESHRPLLNVPDPKAKIQELLKFRQPFYKKADFYIDTSDLTIGQVITTALKSISYK